MCLCVEGAEGVGGGGRLITGLKKPFQKKLFIFCGLLYM